jgi:hypothetical protein
LTAFQQVKSNDFENPKPTEWLVEGVIPKHGITTFIAKSKNGKSRLVDWLSICIIHGKYFLGYVVHRSNVLLIDEDTATDALLKVINSMEKTFKEEPKGKLWKLSQRGLKAYDGTLKSEIKKYPDAEVIIIDSVRRVIKDPNSEESCNELIDIADYFVKKGKTVILVHHISIHSNISPTDIMETEDPSRFCMNNSKIYESSNNVFFLAKANKGENLETIWLRPDQKQYTLKIKSSIIKYKETRSTIKLAMNGEYKIDNKDSVYTEPDKDVLRFLKMNKYKSYSTNRIKESLGNLRSYRSVEISLDKFTKIGIVEKLRETEHYCYFRISREYYVKHKKEIYEILK